MTKPRVTARAGSAASVPTGAISGGESVVPEEGNTVRTTIHNGIWGELTKR